MPGLDGSGPQGEGPRTGRGRGKCGYGASAGDLPEGAQSRESEGCGEEPAEGKAGPAENSAGMTGADFAGGRGMGRGQGRGCRGGNCGRGGGMDKGRFRGGNSNGRGR